MVTESFLSLACAGLIGILFGLVLCFAGYRLFIILLPIWGFVFGLVFGAQSIQLLFGTGFLATVSSWVVGLIVGAIFAVLSYLFYIVAVAIIAGSLGYGLTVAFLFLIGMDANWLMWLIGIVVAIAFAVVTIVFNLQKWVVIAATAILGSAAMIETVVFLFRPAAVLLENPVKAALDASPLLLVVFLVFAILGIVAQVMNTRNFVVEEYSRYP
jgi:cell division protein FtsL